MCEQRDVKGLYAKARAGVIKNFTGISDPYEEPANPELRIESGKFTVDECANQVIQKLVASGMLERSDKLREVPALFRPASAEEAKEFEALPVLEIDVEQVEYLQTIGQGWAYPLRRFMNELELLECIHMKTMTNQATGERLPLSVPITQYVTKADRERLEGQSKIAIKCPAISDQILAVIEEPEFFENRKEEISARVFGTQSVKHPKVERIMA